jgi:hypothetical protein
MATFKRLKVAINFHFKIRLHEINYTSFSFRRIY